MSRWAKAKAAILRAGRSIKNKSYKYRYYLAYGILMLVIAIAGLRARSRALRLTRNVEISKSAIAALVDGDETDLKIILGRALKNEEITTKLDEYARNPKKGETIASLSKDLCKWGPDLCSKGVRKRIHMPQINLKNKDMTHWVRGQGNMSFDPEKISTFNPKNLIPLQTQLDAKKVIGMAGAIMQGKLDPESVPVVIAEIGNERYMVNGHHRWKAAEIAGKSVRAVMIKAKKGVKPTRVLNAVTLAPRGVSFAA